MTWNDITLQQYRQIEKIQAEHPDDSAIHIINYLYGDNIESLPLAEYARRMEEIQFLSKNIPSAKLKLDYVINGNKYELDITPADLTTAQFIDSQNYLKQGGDVQNLLSVYLIPKGKKYAEGYDVEKVKNDVLSLPMPEVMGICRFFQNWLAKFVKVFRHCLTRQMKKGMDKGTVEKIRIMMDEMEKNMVSAFSHTY